MKGKFMAIYRTLLKALISVLVFIRLGGFSTAILAGQSQQSNPVVIKLEIPPPADLNDSAGGIIVTDTNNDGRMDYLVTVRGHLAVYNNSGEKLWIKKADISVG